LYADGIGVAIEGAQLGASEIRMTRSYRTIEERNAYPGVAAAPRHQSLKIDQR